MQYFKITYFELLGDFPNETFPTDLLRAAAFFLLGVAVSVIVPASEFSSFFSSVGLSSESPFCLFWSFVSGTNSSVVEECTCSWSLWMDGSDDFVSDSLIALESETAVSSVSCAISSSADSEWLVFL